MFVRQTVGILYAAPLLIASMDAVNAARQELRSRLYLVRSRGDQRGSLRASVRGGFRCSGSVPPSRPPLPSPPDDAQYLVLLGSFVALSLLYAVQNFANDASVTCSSADNPETCESVVSSTGGIIVTLSIMQLSAAGLIFLAIPGVGRRKEPDWEWGGNP